MTASVEGVIFDFDGTLVDTMPLHYEAYRRAFDESGLSLTRDEFNANIGGKATETIPRLLRGRDTIMTISEIHHRKKAHLAAILDSTELRVLETAKLLELVVHVPKAIASSGARPGIEKMLARLRWRDHFAVIVTGEDAARGKPAPDLFLLAAERLGVPAASCLVFEDTDAGVEAARAAGMRCFDVRRTIPAVGAP